MPFSEDFELELATIILSVKLEVSIFLYLYRLRRY